MGIQLNGITGDAIIPGDVGIGGTLTYEDVTNVDSLGVGTFRDGLRVTGICTATEFHGAFVGDGANITGVSGFATVLSTTQGTLENLCFKTPEAFTRLSSINVSTGATFHVSAGTTFIMNVLNVF